MLRSSIYLKELPLVSVLMTAFNREKYIAEAIESVLHSTYTNFELIIVDDGSKDNTVKIAESYADKNHNIRLYINKKNLGDYPNRNQAAAYAKGKYLKYVDSDDLIYPHTLSFMVDEMEKHPSVALGLISRTETETTLYSPAQSYRCHFFSHGLLDCGPTGVIMTKEHFEKCGRFKEIRNVSDFDMWLRIAAKYNVLELPKDLVFWREHSDQEIKLAPLMYMEHLIPILTDNLFSKDCPLSNEESSILIRSIRKRMGRQIIKKLLYMEDVHKCVEVLRKQKITFFDLI
jgi:glycosyltransferase involved in cell wall biosynthesis